MFCLFVEVFKVVNGNNIYILFKEIILQKILHFIIGNTINLIGQGELSSYRDFVGLNKMFVTG